ncbi:MAG: 3-keto-disaccharide hydrolase [Bacteroidales bacterium]
MEDSEGFTPLIHGTSLEGWRGYNMDHLPSRWKVEDGIIHFDPDAKGEGGDIIYDKPFGNFYLKLEWKISEGGNSGIFYLGKEGAEHIYSMAPEMQVLDNQRHPDAKLGKDGNRQAGSLYDLIPAIPQNFRGAGEWNQVEIIHKDGHVVHMQNGEKVVEYQVGTEEWKKLVAGSKFPALNPDWANVAAEGYIGLQDHGDNVWYRNIWIKEL